MKQTMANRCFYSNSYIIMSYTNLEKHESDFQGNFGQKFNLIIAWECVLLAQEK